MAPPISVVMPAYNAERTLKESVHSVLSQTYENFELIIVENGSTDNTKKLLKTFQDSRIRAFYLSENKGASYARNYAIRQAAGEWVAFLDSDDLWTREKLEKQVSFMERNDWPLLSFTGSSFIKNNGDSLNYILHVPSTVCYEELLKQNVVSCSSVIARRDILLDHPFPEEKVIHEDFAVWLSILKEGSCAMGLDEPLLIYRLNENGKSSNKAKAALMNWHTYRYIGLSLPKAFSSMVSYTIRGLKKYRHLK